MQSLVSFIGEDTPQKLEAALAFRQTHTFFNWHMVQRIERDEHDEERVVWSVESITHPNTKTPLCFVLHGKDGQFRVRLYQSALGQEAYLRTAANQGTGINPKRCTIAVPLLPTRNDQCFALWLDTPLTMHFLYLMRLQSVNFVPYLPLSPPVPMHDFWQNLLRIHQHQAHPLPEDIMQQQLAAKAWFQRMQQAINRVDQSKPPSSVNVFDE